MSNFTSEASGNPELIEAARDLCAIMRAALENDRQALKAYATAPVLEQVLTASVMFSISLLEESGRDPLEYVKAEQAKLRELAASGDG